MLTKVRYHEDHSFSCKASGSRLVTKGTYAKMARREMVRYMAEMQIKDPNEIKKFDRLGYVYREELSSELEYVFERVRETVDRK